MHITPVILAGGSGTRLWPLSTDAMPKPFLRLHSTSTSLFQDTLSRVALPTLFTPPLVVARAAHTGLIHAQNTAIGTPPAFIISEQESRNTAASVALAALHLQQSAPHQPMLVLPSDHQVTNLPAFHEAITRAIPVAQAGKVVTFCAPIWANDSAYGYIAYAQPLAGTPDIFSIDAFYEKPAPDTIAALRGHCRVGVNCGIFLLTPETALAELATHAPALLKACRHAYDTGTLTPGQRATQFPKTSQFAPLSFDQAVMEHTLQGAVVPIEMGWSDLGNFASLMHHQPADMSGNISHGAVFSTDTSNCYIYSDGIAVRTQNIRDALVVAAPEGVFVSALPGSVLGTSITRPWGHYYRLGGDETHQVKRLHLRPGAKISLQKHEHRSEHWVVLSGRAIVTREDTIETLETGQSTYIPAGTVHRLENRGTSELIIIEVQTGTHLSEDDIIRLEDCYNRA